MLIVDNAFKLLTDVAKRVFALCWNRDQCLQSDPRQEHPPLSTFASKIIGLLAFISFLLIMNILFDNIFSNALVQTYNAHAARIFKVTKVLTKVYKKELLALVIIISMWSYKTDGISIIFKMMLKFEDSFVWISESSFRLSLWQLLSKLKFAKTCLTFLEVNIIRDLENSNHSRWFSELQQSKILITFLFRTSCFKTGFPVNLQRTIYSSDKNNRRL